MRLTSMSPTSERRDALHTQNDRSPSEYEAMGFLMGFYFVLHAERLYSAASGGRVTSI